MNSLREKLSPSFEECMSNIRAYLTQVSPPSPTPAYKENWVAIDSRTQTACILDEQGNVEYTELPNPCGGRHNDK